MSEIIQLLGPTGIGKTDIAIQLSGEINGEIISADSIQVYRGFDIGSSKISPNEMKGIPHHLIDVLDPSETFNVNRFIEMSKTAVECIQKKKKIPLVCGGTALYLRAMITGIFEESGSRRISREILKEIGTDRGYDYLWSRLFKIDPEYAEKIGKNDRKRIVRGLEVYYNNHVIPSRISEITSPPFKTHQFIRIGLILPREEIYRRIDLRVDRMIESGLVDEVKKIREKYGQDCAPLQSIGYKEIGQYLDGLIGFDRAVDLIKQHTRNFSKRQLSWFRNENDIIWFSPDDRGKILFYLKKEFLIG